MNELQLAAKAYAYAEEHYGDRDARFDVIVECMSIAEIMEELTASGVKNERGAIAWAKRRAGLHHEQELNQAWDGPESVKSSSKYRPECDPAGPPPTRCRSCGETLLDQERGGTALCDICYPSEAGESRFVDDGPDFIEHIDSYTGYPHYTANSERARKQVEEYDRQRQDYWDAGGRP